MQEQILVLIAAYVVTSLWETFIHWKILHSRREARLIWKRLGVLGDLLRRAYFSHNIIHHQRTFRDSYFVQFNSLSEQDNLDGKLPAKLRKQIKNNKYGLTISSFWEFFTFLAFSVITNTVLLYQFSALPTFVFVMLISIAPALLSKYLHPRLHVDDAGVRDQGGLWGRYVQYIKTYHETHHRVGLKNFNLLPGGDFIVGAYQSDKLPQ